MKWHPFNKEKGFRQLRPPIGKYILVILAVKSGDGDFMPNGVAIGYRKDAAGDKSCPYFVTEGLRGQVIGWCDCLPEDYKYPNDFIKQLTSSTRGNL